eukprot:TRINITY_DN73035_c0_g1_i1.p1 TRINITY_DN73035_c0_g1~~TRINITY_DN73035_c0_g1_i1.p1  ORF type:complete len:319 (-),score=61.89 TRINITY_DN73035_c0_g1_i1:233-1189(-)
MVGMQTYCRVLVHSIWLLLLAADMSRPHAAPLLLAAAAQSSLGEEGCTITAKVCANFPEFQRKQFRDDLGEEHLGTRDSEAACLKRAEEFHHWCGNAESEGVQVAATYNPMKWSQIYNPGACDKGWSQWDSFCYKFYLEMKTWFEAEQVCRDSNANLVSVHSRAENRFVNSLAHGLKVWIGYTDLDKDTHYQWSDNTQDDFTNFAKNCSGREHEPDCQREEVQQQWYKSKGDEKSPYVCKKSALLPLSLLRNVSAAQLTQDSWAVLSPGAQGVATGEALFGEKLGLKTQELLTTEPSAISQKGLSAPRLIPALPKGSF